MLESPGRPGSPISGERSDIEVSRCAAQGLWSCSRSKKNKMVKNAFQVHYMYMYMYLKY